MPNISINSLPADGLVLLPSTHPAFAAGLAPARALEGDALLPYAVLLHNTTEKEVLAYTVVWNCVDSTGTTVVHHATYFDFQSLRGILPHQKRIVSIAPGLNTSFRADAGFERQVAEFATFYSKQSSITVILDAVVFIDGTAIGEDTQGWIPRLKARLDAERDIAADMVQIASADLRRFLDEKKSRAISLLPAMAPRNSAGMSVAANNSDYRTGYTLMQGTLLRKCSSVSTAGLLQKSY